MAGSSGESSPRDAAGLDLIFKAYDVRGLVPEQFDAEIARRTGAAFVEVLGIRAQDGGPGAVVIGQDMRPSGDELVAAFAEGVCAQGCDVIRIGLASTDGLYFASGDLGLPGAMFTASHNPAEYNGIKLCRAGAAPVGRDTGLVLSLQLAWSGDSRIAVERDDEGRATRMAGAVTDITDRVAQIRCLASARNAPTAFDLRCEIREKMLAFIRDECPEALPRQRQKLLSCSGSLSSCSGAPSLSSPRW